MDPSKREAQVQRYGVSSVLAHLAMCAATAVLLTLAFPLPGWSFMAYFALVPVGVLLMRTRSLWTLAWTSYLVFLVWWVLRTLWLKDVQIVAPLAIAVVCAGYFSITLVLLGAVQRRFRGAMTVTLPIFWCAQEFIRSLWPLGGFAWFTLGSSQAAWREGQSSGLIVQSADLFGWVTVSFLIAMTSGLMVDLVARPLSKRLATGVMRPRRTIVVALLLWLSCMTGALIYGKVRIAQTPTAQDPNARRIVVGIVQTNVPQSNKRQGSDVDLLRKKMADFDRLITLSETSATDDPRPDLIIWPETMVTTPINDEAVAKVLGSEPWPDMKEVDQAYRQALSQGEAALELLPRTAYTVLLFRHMVQEHVSRHGIPVLVGGQALGFASHERSMNSALLARPGVKSVARYSKMHLVPLGEYIPGPPWLRQKFMENFSPYSYDYTVEPGEGVVIFEVEAAEKPSDQATSPAQPVRFATPICYEDAVAVQCRKMVYGYDGKKRADLLINLTNDGWYAGSHQGYQHLQLAVMRCIENRVPMARSVNTGVSGLIDSAGRVGPLVSLAGEYQQVEGHVNAVAVIDDRSTLYGQVREGFGVGLCTASLLLWIGVFVPGNARRQGDRSA